jgi:hypothetical protein
VKKCCFTSSKISLGVWISFYGQEWLSQNDYVMTCPNAILPFNESVVKVPSRERGVRLIERQELLPGVYCGSSLSLCHEGYFHCLVVNMTPFPILGYPYHDRKNHRCVRGMTEVPIFRSTPNMLPNYMKSRVCIDFRQLNEVSVGDSYPLPNIQDILDKIGKARYFSVLDCASGYHQIPIRQEDKCKTTFSTP